MRGGAGQDEAVESRRRYLIALPDGVVDADGEEDDDQESRAERGPDEGGDRLAELGRDHAGDGEHVEDDHEDGDRLGDEAEPHGAEAGHLQRGWEGGRR